MPVPAPMSNTRFTLACDSSRYEPTVDESPSERERKRSERGDIQLGGRIFQLGLGGDEFVFCGQDFRCSPDRTAHVAAHGGAERGDALVSETVAREAGVRVAFVFAIRDSVLRDVSVDFFAPDAE